MMKMIIKLIGYSIITVCLASNTFAMWNEEETKEKDIPVVVKIGENYEGLEKTNEVELGKKWAEFYMESDSSYKKESGSYSGSSEQYGNTTYESGDTYYKDVTLIVDSYKKDILSHVGGKSLGAIRVKAGWHQNKNDTRHITLSFLDGDFEEDKSIKKLHLDENGIRE